MSKKRKEAEGLRFEEALNRLEEITRLLESGELSLDESLAAYEEGIRLRDLCTSYLSQAEKRLQMLQKKDGDWEAVDIAEEPASLF
jgi:exodeoxyribonuclease VII small subunit